MYKPPNVKYCWAFVVEKDSEFESICKNGKSNVLQTEILLFGQYQNSASRTVDQTSWQHFGKTYSVSWPKNSTDYAELQRRDGFQ